MEKLSVKKPFTILVAVIMVLVLGVVSVTRMTTDLLPNMSLPYLMVVTTYPGASPERVENDVVKPMEGALGTITGVENVYSTSSENYGMVQLEFADGTDMESTLVKVSSALQEMSASLPDTCGTPSIIEISMDMMATMYISVSREGYDIYELSTFVKDTVQPYLERQNGVASISNIGLVEQNIHVELDPAKIQALNEKLQAFSMPQDETAASDNTFSAALDQMLDIDTLSKLIYAQNFSMPAGYIDDAEDNSWLLKVGEAYQSAEDISNTLLLSIPVIGQVRISDVANVTVIDNAALSYARLSGEQSVILSIFKGSTTGTNATAKNCIKAFDELEEKHEGTKIVTLMNQGSYIDLIIKSILSSMALGALLAIIILALFLKDVKPTLVVAISIPLSVLFTLVLMYFTNISLNMMTLSGLALGIGMLVDNSVVVIENIYRLRARGISAARAAVQGTKQVAGAIISSTLTTVCVFLPMVFTQGMVRELLLPLGLCIGFCLMASLIVALTVVPAAASTLLRNSKPKSHPLYDKFLNVYGKFLDWCLNRKLVPLLVAVALLVGSVWAVFNTGIVLLPEMTGDQIQVSVSTPEDLTREESYAMADDVIERLLKVDGITDVGVMDDSSAAGMMSGMLADNSEFGSYTYYVIVPEGTSVSKIQSITEQINQVCADLPCTVEASAGGMSELVTMLGSGLKLNIYGSDLEVLETISDQVAQIVATVPGYTEITTSFTEGDPTIHLQIDKDKAMEAGLTVAQIYATISEKMTTTANSTTITVNGTTMDVTVVDNTEPLTVENLLDITFETTVAGMTIPHTLSEFATVVETTSVDSIGRENQGRYVTVSAAVEDGYNATLLARQLDDKLEDFQEQLPYGYTVSIEGESETVNEMVSQMLLLLLLGFIFIYLVMVAQFQSLKSPFIVLFTIPLAFTGGMIGLLITGQQLSLLSLMGFAILMGTVVNNGIVFVDYVNQLRIGGMDRRSALIATGKTRMRPILMTTLTTILAMFQMVFTDDMAGQLGGGMSIVIIGGLLYATLMTLVIVPVIYDILFKRNPRVVDIGSENLDDIPDDAAEFIAQALAEKKA